jgi:hypothetical protein
MLLKKLKTITLAVLLVGTLSGGVGVWAHWPSQPPGRATRGDDPASNPTRNPVATPVPGAKAVPQPATQPPAGSQALVADNPPADCPLGGPGECSTSCPLTMAANALARFVGQFHDGSASSK